MQNRGRGVVPRHFAPTLGSRGVPRGVLRVLRSVRGLRCRAPLASRRGVPVLARVSPCCAEPRCGPGGAGTCARATQPEGGTIRQHKAGNKAVTSRLLPPCRLCPQSSLRAPASRLGRCRPEHAPSCASARGNETQGQAVLQQRHTSQRPQALAREASPSFSPCSPAGWVPLAVQSSLCIQLLLTQSTFPAGHAHARTWLQ